MTIICAGVSHRELRAEAGRGPLGDAAAALFGLDDLGTQHDSDFNVFSLASRQ